MNIQRAIIFIFALTFTKQVNGQSAIPELSKKFDEYRATWPQTKIHLILNQDKYSPGDTIWFKAYFLLDNFKPVDGNQLLRVHLVDSAGQSRSDALFSTNNGSGYNQLVIPDSLSAGIYLITAYSSWTRNFGIEQFFKQEVEIVLKKSLIRKQNETLEFAVEGGHLVRDIPNKLAVRTGEAASTVLLKDANGNETGHCTTNNSGIGLIVFTPKKDVMYSLQLAGRQNKVNLPIPHDDGCGLQLLNSEGKSDNLHVRAKVPPSSTLENKEVTLSILSQGRIVESIPAVLSTDEVDILVPLKNLAGGINEMVITDGSGALLSQRLFFVAYKRDVSTKIEGGDGTFRGREKVRLEVSLSLEGKPVQGEFVVSVVNGGLFQRPQITFQDDLLLGSYLSGLRIAGQESAADINDQLILVSSNVPWKDILSNSFPRPKYNFSSVIQKQGVAYAGDSQTVPDGTQIMFYLQRQHLRYSVSTSGSGKFTLTLFDAYGPDEIFYVMQHDTKDIPDGYIKWNEDAITLPRANGGFEAAENDRYAEFALRVNAIKRSYGQAQGNLPGRSNTDDDALKDEFDNVDVAVDVDDYFTFPTMAEFIREVVPAMYHRKRGDRDVVRVKYVEPMREPNQPLYVTGDPLYMIDGVATRNSDFFLTLKPADLVSIGIIHSSKKLARFGIMGKNGIVIVQTKAGNVREPLTDPQALVSGLSLPLNFRAPAYEGKDSHHPDFRTTIYWNPQVRTDSNGKAVVEFFTSDDVGNMRIYVKGLTADGQAFSAEQDIVVNVVPGKE